MTGTAHHTFGIWVEIEERDKQGDPLPTPLQDCSGLLDGAACRTLDTLEDAVEVGNAIQTVARLIEPTGTAPRFEDTGTGLKCPNPECGAVDRIYITDVGAEGYAATVDRRFKSIGRSWEWAESVHTITGCRECDHVARLPENWETA